MADAAIDFRDIQLPVQTVRAALDLRPHPEGGWYRETWRDVPEDGGRGAASLILFLLSAGEVSAWHRVDAAEIWAWHGGAPLELLIDGGSSERKLILGPLAALHAVVPAHCRQAARCLGSWSLVSCVVAPAFEFSGFHLVDDRIKPQC